MVADFVKNARECIVSLMNNLTNHFKKKGDKNAVPMLNNPWKQHFKWHVSRCVTNNNHGNLNWRWQTRIGLQHQQENLDHVRVVTQNDKMSDSDIFDKWNARILLINSCYRHLLSPNDGSSRITMTPRLKSQRTPNLSVKRRRPCPSKRGDPLETERSDLLRK